jgi:hypothetical protein
MKLIVAGSRDFSDYDLLQKSINEICNKYNITEIVSGTARGADSLGELYAKDNGILCSKFPAEWDRYGKSAGHKRNYDMAKYADIAIVFWDEKSRGTKNMIDTMKKLKKPLIVNLYKGDDDEW